MPMKARIRDKAVVEARMARTKAIAAAFGYLLILGVSVDTY